ncbi:MAG: DMT family transporter [Alphaproteobacteria bacterium]|nr:DMT family transporter [Alphaproteobacteria bacterium]
MSRTTPLTGIVLACAAAVSFAANTTASPIAADGGGTVLTYLVMRSTAAALLVFILLLATRSSFRLPPRRRWAAFGVGCVLAIYSVSLLSAIQFIPVALAVLIFYTFPLLTTLYLWISGRERATWTAGVALAIAFVGLILALDLGEPSLDLRGIGLAALAALGVTTVVLLNSRLVGMGDSRPVTFHMLSAACVVFVVVTTVLGEFALPDTTRGWWAFATGPLFYAFAIVTLFIAMSKLGPIRTSMTMNLEPVSSMVFGFLLLGQALDGLQIFGAALVIVAVLTIQRTKRPARAPV